MTRPVLVEFVGGPLDGAVRELVEAPPLLRVPCGGVPAAELAGRRDPGEPPLAAVVEYRRAEAVAVDFVDRGLEQRCYLWRYRLAEGQGVPS